MQGELLREALQCLQSPDGAAVCAEKSASQRSAEEAAASAGRMAHPQVKAALPERHFQTSNNSQTARRRPLRFLGGARLPRRSSSAGESAPTEQRPRLWTRRQTAALLFLSEASLTAEWTTAESALSKKSGSRSSSGARSRRW